MARKSQDKTIEIKTGFKQAKKSLFRAKTSRSADKQFDVSLHYNWDSYTRGYQRAADVLVQHVIDNNLDQELLVYPVVFLYRQHLDVRLKELVVVSSMLSTRGGSPPANFDFLAIWEQVRLNVKEIWSDTVMNSQMDIVEARIKELCNVEARSFTANYRVRKTGDAAEKAVINLKQLRDTVQEISDFLESLSLVARAYLDKV